MLIQCITLHAQWAEAIFSLGKDVENRDWFTRYRGPLAIHAGNQLDHGICVTLGFEPMTMPRGFLLGVVDLVDIVEASTSKWANPAARYHWLLANPRRLATPIPMRGRQKLYSLPESIILEVSEHAAVAYKV